MPHGDGHAAVMLMLLAGCSSLFGPSQEEEAAAVSETVQSRSAEISTVEVVPAVDGLSKYLNLDVTVAGDQVAAAQIEQILIAATGAIQEGIDSVVLCVWQRDGLDRFSLLDQAQKLAVPEEYILNDSTLSIPLDWLQQQYGAAQ